MHVNIKVRGNQGSSVRPPKPQIVKKDAIKKITRFVTDKATIHDEKKANILLGGDIEVSKLGITAQERDDK